MPNTPEHHNVQRPRGGFDQDGSFVSRELMGERVLRVLSWGVTPNSSDMLLLQCGKGIWQRLFLEADMMFWSEVSGDEDAFAGYEDIVEEFVDLSERLGSKELILETIEGREGAECFLEITFDSGGCIRLEPVDPMNFETDIRLIIRPAPTSQPNDEPSR